MNDRVEMRLVDLEALAHRVADLVAERVAAGPPLVDADALAKHLGVERSYVYEHAIELGAIRLGAGPKARLRFNIAEVERRLTCQVSRGQERRWGAWLSRNRAAEGRARWARASSFCPFGVRRTPELRAKAEKRGS